MFNHAYTLIPELLKTNQKPESLRKKDENEREKQVRLAQEQSSSTNNKLAKCA